MINVIGSIKILKEDFYRLNKSNRINNRYKEIPKDKDIIVICPYGIRSNIVDRSR